MHLDDHPISCHQLARIYQMDGSQLQQQYKHHISDYKDWNQREHAKEWMLFEKNMGTHLSIDETLYPMMNFIRVVTNKQAKARRGAHCSHGSKAPRQTRLLRVLQRISKRLRQRVLEVTLDMAAGMHLIVKRCFPYAHRVVDRFHVQQLASEAVQEIRIKHRWQAIDEENEQIALAKKQGITYIQQLATQWRLCKQLLARSRYLLFKHKEHWTYSQKQRAELMFERYPAIKAAHDLSMKLTGIFNHCKCKEEAFKKLALWYNEVEAAGIDSFRSVAKINRDPLFDLYSTTLTTEVPTLRLKLLMLKSKL